METPAHPGTAWLSNSKNLTGATSLIVVHTKHVRILFVMTQPLEKLSLASVQFSVGRSHIKATSESLPKEVQSQHDGELTAFSLKKRS